MTPERFAAVAREMAADFALDAEDLDAILPQAQRILDAIAQLDELPLDSVEPAPIFKVVS
jgi:hypothetical protein